MYREMRRVKQSLNQEAINRILIEGEYGNFSTITKEGFPYGVPLSYTWDGESIYLHSFLKGLKIENINDCSKSCFTVVGKTKVLEEKFTTEYESVIIFGESALVEDENEKIQSLMRLSEKYALKVIEQAPDIIKKQLPATQIIKVTPIHITGKKSQY